MNLRKIDKLQFYNPQKKAVHTTHSIEKSYKDFVCEKLCDNLRLAKSRAVVRFSNLRGLILIL